MNRTAVSFFMALVLQASAFAHKNVILQYTLKNVSKDLTVVKEPTAKPAADVLDVTVLNAIIRTRTAGFLVQSANDRKGKIEGGQLILDEMTPAPIEEENDLVKAQQMLDAHNEVLVRVKGNLQKAEGQLKAELSKSDAANRDFSAVKNSVKIVESALLEILP